MDRINELLEKVQKDNTTLAIAIIVSVIVYIILALTCVALYNFVCVRDVDDEEQQDGDWRANDEARGGKRTGMPSRGQRAGLQIQGVGDGAKATRIVSQFSVAVEKDRIVQNIKNRLRQQAYQTSDFDSPVSLQSRDSKVGLVAQSVLSSPSTNQAIDVCTLCNKLLTATDPRFLTACKHLYHQQCLLNSINTQIEKNLRQMHGKTLQGRSVDLAMCSAECPTCGFLLDQAPPVEEQLAISQIGGILHMLSIDEEIPEAESGKGDDENPVGVAPSSVAQGGHERPFG